MINEGNMRKHLALCICTGAAVLALFLGYQGVHTWAWVTEMTAIVWVFTSVWLAKRSLNRTHNQLVAEETNFFTQMRGLPRQLFNGAMLLTTFSVILYFKNT